MAKAKKVSKRLEEDKKYKEFQFPEFDVRGFILHELEQSYATALALSFAFVLALASWRITLVGLSSGAGVLPFALGCLFLGALGAFAMTYLIQRLRPASEEYRRGDWAGLVMVYVFLWLGVWALLLNL